MNHERTEIIFSQDRIVDLEDSEWSKFIFPDNFENCMSGSGNGARNVMPVVAEVM